jgi:hypothetical protein
MSVVHNAWVNGQENTHRTPFQSETQFMVLSTNFLHSSMSSFESNTSAPLLDDWY